MEGLLPEQSDPNLVDECGGLEGMARPLGGQMSGGQSAQLVLDPDHDLFRHRSVAVREPVQ